MPDRGPPRLGRRAGNGPLSRVSSSSTTIVQETRSAFQNAMQHKFITAAERLSGRDVVAFISHHHVGRDLEIELFML